MKKGSIEMETIVKIVIVLFALIMIIVFVTGGFEGIGSGISEIGTSVTGQGGDVGETIKDFSIP